jgi:hypothetical protein
VPDLTFHIDRSEKMKARIDQLLGRKRQARLRAQNSGSDGGSASPQQEKTQDPGK